MPRGDRTGPWGLGPKTGRAAGYCAGYSVPGFMNPTPEFGRGYGYGRGGRGGRGRGFGMGRGRGYGRRWWWYPPLYQHVYPSPVARPQSAEEEVAALEDYKKRLEAEKSDLEQEMDEVRSRIEKLKAAVKPEEK